MKTTIKVSGMTCQNCVKHVKEAIDSLEGASEVSVDLASGTATFTGIDSERAIAAVNEEGYKASQE
ncbi:MAG: heavy-metal-associated domain-containing protein [Fimbriimonadaceae bacterium]|jgi:copper chaperone CopZ|nr:heavy-metal-associated domain-containing protein [Fimbriimonadaceae bacterium]